jgi:hypothetical protein
MTAEDLEVSAGGRVVAKGLWTRLTSHTSGRRSGDQFCVYVCDRFVVQGLTPAQQHQLAVGSLSLDSLVRAFVHEPLAYRFVICSDGTEALKLEREVRARITRRRQAIPQPVGAIEAWLVPVKRVGLVVACMVSCRACWACRNGRPPVTVAVRCHRWSVAPVWPSSRRSRCALLRSRPVADASGARVLRDQGPIGRPGTARPIQALIPCVPWMDLRPDRGR